tara:strand:- start:145 stop:549 length:405 start_codon:yes stop_codon:yes gene_type:complete
MRKIFMILMMFVGSFSSYSQEGENRFVYELTFEFSPNAAIADAEKQFFIFYDGFKQSEYSTSVVAHQHHTGYRMDYKILAYTDSWDKIDDMVEDAQNYFAEKDPTMFTDPWKIIHTGDAIYAVRKSAEEGYITK